ncbi:hypothetical protein KIL84_009980 [Mauremys mutica]|uniref:Uncharacterized protein n=1 Tax=Mauremys mutica TaxID=74926 RepID=A0A9D3XMK2_9SAUR|nr:hypothetical protein KIL84_009980 [Mauremys mutica]
MDQLDPGMVILKYEQRSKKSEAILVFKVNLERGRAKFLSCWTMQHILQHLDLKQESSPLKPVDIEVNRESQKHLIH